MKALAKADAAKQHTVLASIQKPAPPGPAGKPPRKPQASVAGRPQPSSGTSKASKEYALVDTLNSAVAALKYGVKAKDFKALSRGIWLTEQAYKKVQKNLDN
jgi:hypothetical protein